MRSGPYRIFWFSTFLAFAAVSMQMMARTWYLYDLTGRAILIGVLNLAFALPMLSFSLFGGALADRLPKRSLLLVSQIGMAVLGIGLALIIRLGAIEWWHLILASTLQGTVMAFMGPARQAIIPELVERRYLLNAISLGAAQMNITRIAAPGLAGVLIGTLGMEAVFWVMGALAAGSFVLVLFLPSIQPAGVGQARTVPQDMAQAVTYIKGQPVIRDLLVVAFVAAVFGSPINLLLPVFAEDVLDVGPEGFGLLISMMGLGALVGSMIIASLGDYQRKGLLMMVLTLLFGGAIVLFTRTHQFYLAMATLALVGLGQSGRMALNQTLVQMATDSSIRGRVMAVYQMEMGLQPLGLMPISAGVEAIGAPLAMGISGGIVFIHALGVLLFQSSIRKLE